ncbi:MAG TPA: ABC transporter substrate-binding protein [Anaerolineae bacterium]|nr:ABC transporter substrate-binding protein [Anaerolineae bacterium]
MKLRSSYAMSILLLVALLLGVMGCGTPAPAPATQVPGEPTATQPSAPAETPTSPPAPAEKPVIVIAHESDISHINPEEAKSRAGYDAVDNLYEPVIMQVIQPEPGQEGVFRGIDEWECGMCDEMTVDEENNTIRFHIPDGLKFANGNPITAHSFKAVYQLLYEMPTAYTRSLMPFVGLESYEDIIVEDDNTLEFRLAQMTPLSLDTIAFKIVGAVDQATIEEHATADDPTAAEWLRTNANPSGPYVITEWSPGVQYVFEPNPNYWQGPDFYQNSKVIMRVVPSAEDRELLLRSGDVDLAMGLPYKDIDDLEADPNVKVYPVRYQRTYYAAMNNNIPPFDNKLLRQALSYAVPYDTIIEEVFYGYAQQATSPIPKGMPTHTDDFGYEYDLDKARELLAEAGYADGLDLELAVRMSVPWDVEAATWIQSSFAEIGVNLTINRLVDAEYAEKQKAHELPFYIHDWHSWGNDPSYQLSFLMKCGQATNYADYCNERVDELIETAAWSIDPEVREPGMYEAQQIIMEDAPWLLLYQPDKIYAVSKDFTGLVLLDTYNLQFAYMGKTSE